MCAQSARARKRRVVWKLAGGREDGDSNHLAREDVLVRAAKERGLEPLLALERFAHASAWPCPCSQEGRSNCSNLRLHPVPYRGSGGMRRACSALALVLALGRVVATAAFVTGPPSAGGARRQWCVFSCLCVGGFVCSAPRRNPQRERALTAPVQKDIALQLLASLRGRGDGARSL